MTQDQHKLEPCPWCGGVGVDVVETSTFRWRVAQCKHCGAQCSEIRVQTMGNGTREEWEAKAHADAIEAWNRRAHLQQRPLPVREGSHRWNIERDGDDLLVCFDLHDKGQPCEYERFVRSPSLPVREEPTGWKLVPVEPTPEMLLAGRDAPDHAWGKWDAMVSASPSVQNIGEGETGKDGVDVPRAADPLEGAPEVCEGCGAIEARNESHHHACPRGVDASEPQQVDDLPALVRQLVRALRKAAPGHALADRAADYLKRKGLQGSPLRDGVSVGQSLTCEHGVPHGRTCEACDYAAGVQGTFNEQENDRGG